MPANSKLKVVIAGAGSVKISTPASSPSAWFVNTYSASSLPHSAFCASPSMLVSLMAPAGSPEQPVQMTGTPAASAAASCVARASTCSPEIRMPAGSSARASSNAAGTDSTVSAPATSWNSQPIAAAASAMEAFRRVFHAVPSDRLTISDPAAGAAARGASTPMLVGAARAASTAPVASVAACSSAAASDPKAPPLALKFGSSAGIAHEARTSAADAATATETRDRRMELTSGDGNR